MTSGMSEAEYLVQLACQGDVEAARSSCSGAYRGRLRQMVAVRLDPRLAARFDPSDVVQEALLDAAKNLSEYLVHTPYHSIPGSVSSPGTG